MASNELSFFNLVAHASLVVQIIMAGLAAASLVSWAVIFAKRGLLSRLRREADHFEEQFWSGGQLGELYDTIRREGLSEGLPAVFVAGYEEYARHRSSKTMDPDDVIAAVQRQMRVAQAREVERMEGGLALLATIGSTSPYVGLFGTVWGIMVAFVGIAKTQTTSLAVVAPGIAGALLATAAGLAAAIPAVLIYNFAAKQISKQGTKLDDFASEFIALVSRDMDRRAG